MEPTRTGFGKRLFDLRMETGKSLESVVLEINDRFDTKLTRGAMSRWERGENEPSLRLAKYLCIYYGVSLDYMIGLAERKGAPGEHSKKG